MSKKDFIKGIETATKANEAFMKKQAAATEELGKRIIQKFDEQGNIIDVIIDTLNMQEKKELYNLQSSYDIADLDKNEKEVLASYLLTLISKYGQDTQYQKDFYFAVKNHLDVTDVSMDFDLSLVENIDSRTELKAIFYTVCEFLFLKTGDTSFLTEFEKEISYFGFSQSLIDKIIAPIKKIYDILGLRGIVEHYIPAEEEIPPEHYGLIAPLEGDFTFDDSNRDIPSGTEKVFENLRIFFPKQLHVDGKAIFSNCELVLDYDGSITIVGRQSDSEIVFKDCEFISKKKTKFSMISIDGKCTFEDCVFNEVRYRYDISDEDNNGNSTAYNCVFIDIDGSSDCTVDFNMNHCHINGCEGTFINADGNRNFNITINNCLVENHTGNFLMACFADQGNKTGVNIVNSTFSNIKAYEKADNLSLIKVDCTAFECSDCIFTDIAENVLDIDKILDSSPSDISKCSFTNCKQTAHLVGIIKDCEFTDMSDIVFGKSGEFDNRMVTVSGCNFKGIDGYVTIEYGKIEHCLFHDCNIMVIIEGISKGKGYLISEANDITFIKCTARSCWSNGPCFLQAKSYLDKAGYCVSFNGCKFKNCKTNGTYINNNSNGIGAFGRSKTVRGVGKDFGTIINEN